MFYVLSLSFEIAFSAVRLHLRVSFIFKQVAFTETCYIDGFHVNSHVTCLLKAVQRSEPI